MSLNDEFKNDPSRNHANGTPEPANRDSERFTQVQKSVLEAACAERAEFGPPVDAKPGWQPSPVTIRLKHGKAVQVSHHVALQRILQNQAELVTA
jgi:hypothetical protein